MTSGRMSIPPFWLQIIIYNAQVLSKRVNVIEGTGKPPTGLFMNIPNAHHIFNLVWKRENKNFTMKCSIFCPFHTKSTH